MRRITRSQLLSRGTGLGRLLLAGACLHIACSPTDPVCLDICSIWSVLEGTVTTSGNVPVPQASVAVRLMYDAAAGGEEVTCHVAVDDEVVHPSTDASGAFVARLHATSIRAPDCAEITVYAPEGSGLMSVVDTAQVGWSINEAAPPVRRIDLVMRHATAQ